MLQLDNYHEDQKMKEIQFLSINKANYNEFDCHTIKSPLALDSFKINLIDLNDYEIFNCGRSNYIAADKIKSKQDLKNLEDMIANSSKSVQIVMLPDNIEIYYGSDYGQYEHSSELKNELNFLSSFLYQYLFAPSRIELGFEPNITKLNNNSLVNSDFYFKSRDLIYITKAENTNKPTTIKLDNNIYLTFLQLDTLDKICDFLFHLKLIEKSSDYPEWLYAHIFDNDEQLNKNIEDCNAKIENLKLEIDATKLQLEQNLYYKSMLIETGDKLVEIVFNTLQEILGVDLSHFVDEKKEDVLFKKDSITYIGEIKGINGGIGNSHISQVDNHKSLYEDKLQEEGAQEESIKKLLIINDQRSKPLNEREPIHQNQINKANKEDVLIIRTSDLLNILEKYRQSKLDREEIFKKLATQTGQIQY